MRYYGRKIGNIADFTQDLVQLLQHYQYQKMRKMNHVPSKKEMDIRLCC